LITLWYHCFPLAALLVAGIMLAFAAGQQLVIECFLGQCDTLQLVVCGFDRTA
jgi:hypothetical protein